MANFGFCGFRTRRAVSLIALCVAGYAAPALGQEAGDDASSASGEIIVTATKRATSLQDTPASVSAITGVELERRGVTDIESLVQQAPGVMFGDHDGASFVSIRGVGASVDIGIGEPSVATYVDGVFLPRQTMGFLQQVDLERVEILRGPQGTLYGRNATGGALNFISRRPSEFFEAGLNAETGSFDLAKVSGFVSGPLAKNVLARASGTYEQRSGFVENQLNGEEIGDVDRGSGRVAVRFLPTADLTIDLSAQYEKSTGASAYQQALSPPTSPLVPPTARFTLEPNRIIAEHSFSARQETFIASAVVNWEIADDLSLKYTLGYIDHESLATFDGDALDYGLVDVENFSRPSESISQELTLSGKTGPLDWLVGGFWFQEAYNATIPAPLPNGVPGALPPGSVSFQALDEETTSVAVYTDLTLHLSERLRLLGGLRWFEDEKEFVQDVGAIIPGLGFFGASNVPSIERDSRVLPKIGLSYDLTDDVMAYAQYQEGRKAGGQNLGVLLSQYRPESIKAYEAGLRTTFANGRIAANAAYFSYEYTDYQVTDLPGGTTTLVQNTDAEIDGAEVEINAQPTEASRLNFGLTWLDARYVDFRTFDQAFPLQGNVNLAGKRLNRSPEFTINAGAEYRFDFGAGFLSSLNVRAEAFHSDDVVLRYFGRENDIQEAYTIVNLSAVLDSDDSGMSLRAYVNNVGDELYKRVVIYSPLEGSYLGNYSEPRTWGLALSARF